MRAHYIYNIYIDVLFNIYAYICIGNRPLLQARQGDEFTWGNLKILFVFHGDPVTRLANMSFALQPACVSVTHVDMRIRSRDIY